MLGGIEACVYVEIGVSALVFCIKVNRAALVDGSQKACMTLL